MLELVASPKGLVMLIVAATVAAGVMIKMSGQAPHNPKPAGIDAEPLEHLLAIGMALGIIAASTTFFELGVIAPEEQLPWSICLMLLGAGCAVARRLRFGRWL